MTPGRGSHVGRARAPSGRCDAHFGKCPGPHRPAENFQKLLRPSFFDLISSSGRFGDIFENYLVETDLGFHRQAPFAFLSIFLHIKV